MTGVQTCALPICLLNPIGQVVLERRQELAVGERTPEVVRAAVESAIDADVLAMHAAFKPPGRN